MLTRIKFQDSDVEERVVHKSFGFRSNIENFSSLGKQEIFATESSKDWLLKLYPHGNAKENEGFLSLYISYMNEDDDLQTVVCFTLSIIDIFGNTCYNFSNKALFRDGSTTHGSPKFISRNILAAKGLLVDDALKIYWTVEIGNPCQTIRERPDGDGFGLKFLGIDLKHMKTDTTIMVKSQKLQVHKFIVSSQSLVFESLFDLSTDNTISIRACDPLIFKELLRYMYTHRVRNLDSDEFQELYLYAHKYAVVGLKEVCTKGILKELSVYNAIDVLIFAHEYGVKSLQRDALQFIGTFAKTIAAKVGWKKLHSYPNLMEDMINYLSQRLEGDKLLSINKFS